MKGKKSFSLEQAVDWEEGSCLRHGHEEFQTTYTDQKVDGAESGARPSPPEHNQERFELS